MTDEKEKFNILVYKNGDKEFRIKSNTSYQVVSKFDADAPDGLQKIRTTKVPDPSIGNNTINLATFDLDRNIYDTGLSSESKALLRLYKNDRDAVQAALRDITKHITNPLMSIVGKNIEPTNFEFWDDLSYKDLVADKVFKTSDPLQRFQLYSLILHGKLAPIEFESDTYFRQSAQFSVENKEEVIGTTQKKALLKAKAVRYFGNLYESNKKALHSILEWMNITGLENADEALMTTVFTNWLERDDNQNPEQFLEVYEQYYNTKSGKAILDIFTGLRQLQKDKLVKRTPEGIVMKDHLLAKDLKESAKMISKDSDLLEVFYALTDKE